MHPVLPWWCICTPVLPWVVYAPLYIPGYTPSRTTLGTPASYLPGYVLHAQRPCGRFTALRRTVVEVTVRQDPLTVPHRFTVGIPVHHPFHCWARRASPYRPVWEEDEQCCAEWSPFIHPFHCWAMMRIVSFCPFWSSHRGYTRGFFQSRTVLTIRESRRKDSYSRGGLFPATYWF